MFREPRTQDDKHLAGIRQLPCLACGNDIQTEAAHVRFTDLRYGKSQTGIAHKPHDWWVVPLCSGCHHGQHSYPRGEREWWQHHAEIDPLPIAMSLYLSRGNHERQRQIVMMAGNER